MDSLEAIKNTAIRTLEMESKAISDLIELVDDDFAKAVKLILKSKGRVIITGIGKSAIIATKIVATLNSTGTPAVFMHAADAIHEWFNLKILLYVFPKVELHRKLKFWFLS